MGSTVSGTQRRSGTRRLWRSPLRRRIPLGRNSMRSSTQSRGPQSRQPCCPRPTPAQLGLHPAPSASPQYRLPLGWNSRTDDSTQLGPHVRQPSRGGLHTWVSPHMGGTLCTACRRFGCERAGGGAGGLSSRAGAGRARGRGGGEGANGPWKASWWSLGLRWWRGYAVLGNTPRPPFHFQGRDALGDARGCLRARDVPG